jgi:phosphate transport system protein
MVTSSEHIVTSYEDELTLLAKSISEMGGMVEDAISIASEALLRLDQGRAKKIIEDDKLIDDMERRIDEQAVSMIARRQPMATDLRMIVASIHVASDLERIGDMAKQLGKRTIQIDGIQLAPQFYNGVRHMTELTLEQVKKALDAFSTRDAAAAIEVCRGDQEIDALYVSLFRELLTYMMEDPRNITPCTHLLFCGKSLERTGDHATNIAEQAYYLETGKNLALVLDESNEW